MSQPILISLSPNTERDDVWLAFRALLSPWRWYDLSVRNRAEKAFSRYLEGKSAVLTSSGRAGLYQLLKAFEIGRGDEVILQAFTCVSVPAPITWAGATPVFVDIEPSTLTLSVNALKSAITEKTKAIIVQHTFGYSAPMADIIKIAREYSLVVIEDCAHALGSTIDGKPNGTLGDAAVFSFGRDKSISCVFGGAVTAQNSQVLARVRKYQASLRRAPRWWIMQQLLHPVLFSIVKPLYFKARLGQVLLLLFQKLGLLSKAVRLEERSAQQPPHSHYAFPAALAILLEHQIEKIDRFRARRAEIVGMYRSTLNLSIPATSGVSWLRLPVRVHNRDVVLDKARTHDMLLGDWYRTPVFPVTDPELVNYKKGMCQNAEIAAQEIMNLPTYPTLTNKQVQKIILFMKEINL